MMKQLLKIIAAVIIGFFPLTQALGEDTDLFDTQIDTTTERPNILLIVDNTANWSTPFTWEKSALVSVFSGLDDRFNVGMMMFTGNQDTGANGGYVRYHIRQMTSANRTALGTMVNGLTDAPESSGGDKANAGRAALSMEEAYRYFAGTTAYGGTGESRADSAALNGSTYNSPISSGCQKNFIIYISNGAAQDNNSDTTHTTSALSSFGGNTSTITLSPSGSQDNVSDEWARFLSSTDISSTYTGSQNIITYTIDVLPSTTGQGPGWTALLKSMASKGKGKYFVGSDSASLVTALQKIFDEIIAANTAFAAVSLPVSVAIRGEYLNQVYMGVFRPDAYKSPRWPGNLKLYELGLKDTGSGYAAELQDADGNAVENTSGGLVNTCARSFWTTGSTFWTFAPQTNCSTADPNSDSPDGDLVEKGGAGQKLRTDFASSQTARNLYTCSSCTAGTLLSSQPFTSANTSLVSAITTAYGNVSNVPVTLARSTRGTTVTGTASSAINLTTGDSITLSSATDSNYNGTYTVTGTPSSTTFTFGVTPVQSPTSGTVCTSGCSAAKANGSASTGSSLSRNVASTGLTVTVTTTSAHGLAVNDKVSISGVSNSTFNGTFTVASVPSTTTFTYTLTAPGYSPTVSSASAKVGSSTATISSATASNYRITATASANLPAAFITNASVSTTGISPSALSCSAYPTACFTVAATGNSCPNPTNPANRVFCYDAIPASLSGSFTVTPSNTPVTISSITRAAYSGTNPVVATVTTSAAHNFTTGNTVTISGAGTADAGYNGTKTITVTGATTFTFNVTVTETPATSATANVTKGNTTAIVPADLINWIRGADNYEDENSSGSTSTSTDIRASVHGDVVHSRPVVLDYFTGLAEDVVVFYGANDGVFHAIQGGTSTGGSELWGFIAPEHLSKFDRLRTQSPTISTSATKPYFFDGAVGSYVKRNSDGTVAKAYIFPTMRRGGRYIYALNVTSKTQPKFLWKKGCSSSSGTASCDSGWGELGQTWSAPVTARLKVNGVEKIALIIGAGYDNATEDVDTTTPGTRTMGRGVFIVDVEDGSIIKSFGASDGFNGSVMGDPFVADITSDGYDDVVYVGDTNGDVWRLDLNSSNVTDWKARKLAALGSNQKLMFQPIAALGTDATGNYFAIMVGAGDREHPKETAAACNVTNYFYMIKDRNTSPLASNSTITTVGPNDLTTVSAGTPVSADLQYGWKLALTADSCEKTVSGSAVADGLVFFNTHAPTDPVEGECSSLGTARTYAIKFSTASSSNLTDIPGVWDPSSLSFKLPGGGLAPQPVSASVSLNVPLNQGDNCTSGADCTCTGGDCKCTGPDCKCTGPTCNEPDKNCGVVLVGPHPVPINCKTAGVRYRTYWYEKKDN